MKTSYGYGPLDPDPETNEEVPEGHIRDFLGDLHPMFKTAKVIHYNGSETLMHEEAEISLQLSSDGKTYLIIDDMEAGHVTYAQMKNDALELTVAGENAYTGKLSLTEV